MGELIRSNPLRCCYVPNELAHGFDHIWMPIWPLPTRYLPQTWLVNDSLIYGLTRV